MAGSRLDQALSLLLQSPPGQTTQVYHDLRGILLDAEANADDKIDEASLQAAAARALEEYNTQQLITTALSTGSDEEGAVIICQAGQLVRGTSTLTDASKRYIHPRAKKSFVYDHVQRTVSDVEQLSARDTPGERTRAALDEVLLDYVKDRYIDGVSSVFTIRDAPLQEPLESTGIVTDAAHDAANHPAENTASVVEQDTSADAATSEETETQIEEDPVAAVADAEAVAEDAAMDSDTKPDTITSEVEEKPTKYAFHHVGNRYNLSNFWSGRWRASYVLDLEANTLTSSLNVQVHYFENGNVQLNASKPRTFTLPAISEDDNALARTIAKLVASYEDAYQHALENTYDELAEKAFKALRRQLPLTRQKVDWDKVLNYRIGEQLGKTSA